MIQEALDMACEQLLDEISIKVMLEKDSVGWKSYSSSTNEERRLYNARVTPPINPHHFFSDEFEQDAGNFCALASVGGTPLFSYPEAHLVQVERGIAPTPPLSSVQDAGTLVVTAPLFTMGDPSLVFVPLHAGEGETDATGEVTEVSEEVLSPDAAAGGDDSLSNTRTEEVVADGATATIEGAALLTVGEPLSEVDNLTALVLPVPLVVPPTPTPPEVGEPKTLRRTNRNAGKADEHILCKTERLAKKKNLEGNSFSSFSDSHIISNLGRIGINLATSDVAFIKNLEVDRVVLSANKNIKVKAMNLLSDDEREERLEEVLNHACGNFNESLLDAENDHILDLSPISRKKKYNNAKNPRKGKLPKKPKTPSKIIIQ
jgi:hypothetical protein